MDILSELLKQKREELDRYVKTIKDATLQQMFSDIAVIERTIEMARDMQAKTESSQAEVQPSGALEDDDLGSSPLSKLGISLIGSIKSLLPQLNGAEFSQPIVYDKLVTLYPNAAPFIQRASIAATLTKLAKDGLIEETYPGRGNDPRRYVVKKQVAESTEG